MNDRPSAATSDTVPEFVPGDDERLESLATTGRGPLRMAAAAILAADSRKAARLARRTARQTPKPSATARAAAQPADRPSRAAASPRAGGALTRSKAAPSRSESNVTPARIQRARSNHQGKLLNGPVEPAQKVADERAWERWESDQPEPDEQNGFDRLDEPRRRRARQAAPAAKATPAAKVTAAAKATPAARVTAAVKAAPAAKAAPPAKATAAPAENGAPRPSWRQRASAALDRLAEQEVARGARIEQRVLPGLGRSSRR